MEFRINVALEVNEAAGELTTREPVELALVYQRGRWQGQAADPPVWTDMMDTMEEAIVASARQVAATKHEPAP